VKRKTIAKENREMPRREKERKVDLTEGNIAIQMILFSLPILVGYIFQTVYNNVDSLVVGNFVGKEALAAVNTCTPVYNLLVGFFIGMSTGASVIFSKCLGAQNYEKLKDAIHTTVFFALVLGIALGVIGVLGVDVLLNILNCPDDIYQYAGEYLRIYIAGLVFTAFYNVGAAVLRSVGDSQSPFYALVISCIVNIILDVFFVVVIPWGVAGVALATVIAQGGSVVLVFRRMMLMDSRYAFSFREMKLDKSLIREIISYGLPAGMQSGLVAFSNLFVNRYTNGFGSSLMAGVGVAQKLDRFVSMPAMALGLAVTTFVSQNVGAQKHERTEKGIRITILMGIAIVMAMGIIMYPYAEALMRLFNRDADVVRYGAAMMRILIPMYTLMAVTQVFSGTLRGYGHAKAVMILSLVGMVVIRQIYLAIFLRLFRSEYVIFIGYPVGWFFSAFNQVTYYLLMKKKGRLVRE